MTLLNLLNCELSWHNRKNWNEAIRLLKAFSEERHQEFAHIRDMAKTIRYRIVEIDPFIQQNTSAVCPSCENVCCINKHGYYDYEDLIYIHALGLTVPIYKEGVSDTDPCQFLSRCGCTIERSIRPFRCNWYFCNALLVHIENGPAKPCRTFIKKLDEIVNLRKKMLDAFFKALQTCPK